MPDIDHWEALFNSKYLREYHLEGKEWKLTIDKVERFVEMTLPSGITEYKSVIHFKKGTRPLVLNKTNGNAIAKAVGTNKPSGWPGQQITLYPTTTQLKGKTVPCIRIK
jgi:hypothetical protein